MDDATRLIFPQLGPVYQALLPWAEMLLRAVVGLTLVPHGLRTVLGLFPSTGAPLRLIGPDLPDSPNYEAECERSQDRETHHHSAHRYLLEASLLVCRTRGY